MLVTSQHELQKVRSLVSASENPVAIDTETNITDLYKDRYCLGISISVDDKDFYIPVGHKDWGDFKNGSENLRIPPDFFAACRAKIIFHNAKFDIQVLERLGLKVPTGAIWDTMLMHHFIDENIKKFLGGHDLDTLGKRYLKESKEVKLAKAMKENWERIPPYIMEKYATQDSRLTLCLFPILKDQMKQAWIDQWETYDRRFMLLLTKMEALGLPVDRELCSQWENKCDLRMQQIREELGFDPAKPSQLHPRLFDNPPRGLGLDIPSFTPKGAPQVPGNWLKSVGHPITALCYEYRKLSKQKSSYFSAYLSLTTRDYPRLHTTFNQHGTTTGRLSSNAPNLQQIPREEYGDAYVKEVFLPEEGKQLWEIDYRTLEYRMSTVYSQEPVLLEIFSNEKDFHQQVANDLGITRHSAKTVNYIMSFGGGVATLAKQLGITETAAKPIHQKYRASYPKLYKKMLEAELAADSAGEIDMWYGRTRHFQYKSEHRKAFNAVIQGGSFEVVKRSMLLLEKAGFTMSNQVHDSVWINVDNEKEVEEAQHIMSDWTTEEIGLTFSTDRKLLKK